MEAADVVVSRSKESECRATEIEVDDSFLPDESPVEGHENRDHQPPAVRRNSVLREKESERPNSILQSQTHQKTVRNHERPSVFFCVFSILVSFFLLFDAAFSVFFVF